MLRLVDAPAAPARGELRDVAVWALEPELAAYVESQLRRCWPGVRVRAVENIEWLATSAIDLCICGVQPPMELRAPTIWLGDVDRGGGVTEISARLWRCRMPITGRHLLSVVAALCDNARR